MYIPSISVILCTIFMCYISHSVYTLVKLFTTPVCSQKPCFHSYLANNPKLQLLFFMSTTSNPIGSEVKKIETIRSFEYNNEFTRIFDVDIPAKTRRNGSLFMHVVLAANNDNLEWNSIKRDGPTVIQKLLLTEYELPRASTFRLLGESDNEADSVDNRFSSKPVTHIRTKLYLNILTELFEMSAADVPPELARFVRINYKDQFLPIIHVDFLKTRQQDLVQVTSKMSNISIEFNYAPIGVGKLKLLAHVELALQALQKMGFTKKDLNEVKGIFSDTNLYLLCGTVFVGSIHMLFDFLAFKNDILFWKRRKNYVGLSARSVLWCTFSQIVIFVYLLDEDTSLLVLIPAGIGTFIELWKTMKIFRLTVSWNGIRKQPISEQKKALIMAEDETRIFDRQAMKYLSYILYPLCVLSAIYSLIYQSYKSWYSWTINSLVNGVYAFGFLFMLPQLFINYKLKSVATLPWRALMYKAFNTFIDDIFAFIITMPTSHRIACFRDDVVFIIYVYQRWLYPVDKTRIDDGSTISEIEETSPEKPKTE
ncbi:lipid scramblase CLPTM1L isoform X2 [Uranotaenia lowii]|uniref:lipid scramblase CLPTM1L isoform X2 n=1 Tax=Uranotaenia lowii TaxID=190385 RepID=UPI0024798476|nr:lipid scramblase CLPTM1L isoform X2 [Uranotaenia lowii]